MSIEAGDVQSSFLIFYKPAKLSISAHENLPK